MRVQAKEQRKEPAITVDFSSLPSKSSRAAEALSIGAPMPVRKARKKKGKSDDVEEPLEQTEDAESLQRHRLYSNRTLSEADINNLRKKAIVERRIPDTALAGSVFDNMQRFPGCILLTKVGKFYESYGEPAIELVGLLGLRMGWRTHAYQKKDPRRYPFAGFPVTAKDKYLKILVNDLGRTVVLVEETEGKNLDDKTIHRVVGRVVTPGTLTPMTVSRGDESRYILSIAVSDEVPKPKDEDDRPSRPIWLAHTDVSTGDFFSKSSTLAQLEDELARIAPREVVLDVSLRDLWEMEQDLSSDDPQSIAELFALLRLSGLHVSFSDPLLSPVVEVPATEDKAKRVKNRPNDILTLEAQATSLLRHHLEYALRSGMPTLSEPDVQSSSEYMHIDAATMNALEIRHAIRFQADAGRGSPLSLKGTLLSVIDRTTSDAGRRLLVRTLTTPLTSIAKISHRQDLVQALIERVDLRKELQDILKPLKDVMRFVQRFRGGVSDASDMWWTAEWIRGVESMTKRIEDEVQAEKTGGEAFNHLEDSGRKRLLAFVEQLHNLEGIASHIEEHINEEAIRDGGLMQTEEEDEGDTDESSESAMESVDTESLSVPAGMSKQNVTAMASHQKSLDAEGKSLWLSPTFSSHFRELYSELDDLDRRRATMQQDLRERFHISEKNLLMLTRSPRIGYCVLVSYQADRAKMLATGAFESVALGKKTLLYSPWIALGAQREQLREQLFQEQNRAGRLLRNEIASYSALIQANAALVDELDMAMSFADTADDMCYVRPILTENIEYKILNGRHPVVEAGLHSSSRTFVPNSSDITIDSHLQVITGPNQGGKSTFLRQTAIMAILAQSGCFVPAEYAQIGIVDKVFSRVGARDDLFRDRSTFMLEMVETAGILRHATERSLVIMDEIGRGTTLNAGISIAYATLDYILTNIKCRTLFATHYHELGAMLKVNEEGKQDKNGGPRAGVEFWCTDVDEAHEAYSYSYKLKPGINFNSHALLAARLAGMPQSFLQVAENMLSKLRARRSDTPER